MSSINLSNRLTLFRIGLVPLFLLLLSFDNIYTHLFALLTFVGATITDYYDGKIARERSQETDFGRLMDPLADKILICTAFIYFVESYPWIPAWIVTIIIAREFVVSGIRMLAASKGKIIVADKVGKLKTISQLTTIIVILHIIVYIKLSEAIPTISYWNMIERQAQILIHVLVGFTLVMSVVSGYNYVNVNRRLFLESIKSPS